MSPVSVVFVVFMDAIELLVAFFTGFYIYHAYRIVYRISSRRNTIMNL